MKFATCKPPLRVGSQLLAVPQPVRLWLLLFVLWLITLPPPPDLFAIARSAVGFYGDEPATYHEATTGPDASQWHDAMQAEMDAMERLEAFKKVPTSSVPEGEKVLPSR